MKILRQDRDAAAELRLSAYGVAQARELRELAESDHPRAEEARAAVDAVLGGALSMREARKLVKRARASDGRKLLSAQIRAELVDDLRAFARERGQLFRRVVEEAVLVYLVAARSTEDGEEVTK